MIRKVILIFLLFLAIYPAKADVITVGHGGGYDFETITAGMNAAQYGDNVSVGVLYTTSYSDGEYSHLSLWLPTHLFV